MHFRQRYCFAEDKSKCGKADEYGVESEEEACKEIECQSKAIHCFLDCPYHDYTLLPGLSVS